MIDAPSLARASRRPRLGDRRLPLHVDEPARRGALRIRVRTFRARAMPISTAISRALPGRATDGIRCRAASVVAALLGSWGIDSRSTVVAYDEGSGAIAARLWWMLRWLGHGDSLVLDGGFAAWEAARLPVEADTPRWEATRYVAAGGRGRCRRRDGRDPRAHRCRAVCSSMCVPRARYRGEQEPIDPVAGHVPGAVNRPFSENVTATGRFRDADAASHGARGATRRARPRRRRRDVRLGRDGVPLAARDGRSRGSTGGRLYAGSWSEWIRDPRRPIQTGAKP